MNGAHPAISSASVVSASVGSKAPGASTVGKFFLMLARSAFQRAPSGLSCRQSAGKSRHVLVVGVSETRCLRRPRGSRCPRRVARGPAGRSSSWPIGGERAEAHRGELWLEVHVRAGRLRLVRRATGGHGERGAQRQQREPLLHSSPCSCAPTGPRGTCVPVAIGRDRGSAFMVQSQCSRRGLSALGRLALAKVPRDRPNPRLHRPG